MVNLPDGWEDMIQVRDFMSPVNTPGTALAILTFLIKNKDGQIWNCQWSVPVSRKLDKDKRLLAMKECYNKFLSELPDIAAKDLVLKSGTQSRVRVSNQEWKYYSDSSLIPYAKYMKGEVNA